MDRITYIQPDILYLAVYFD